MHRNAYLFTLFLSSASAAAQTVEITATRDRARQLDTAAMSVVGRDELLRYGDQSVADALKRVPGITISAVAGRGGEIRMRGLGNGYTQLLLNGQPVPAGFSIDSISPELIERVEIMRVASAETGSQAIAGTINIVLRKISARDQGEFKFGLASSNGEITPDLSAQASGKGNGWSYAMAAVLFASRALSTSTGDELGLDGAGTPNLRRRTQRREHDVRPSINLTPRISWTLPNGDTLSSQNFVRLMALDLTTRSNDRTAVGAPTPFPDNQSIFRAHAETVRSDLVWIHQPEHGGRWEVKLGRNHFQRRGTNDFEGFATGADTALVRAVDSSATEDNVTLGGKFSRSPAGGHTLLAGWDGAHGSRTETRFEQVQPGDTVAAIGNEVNTARLDRMALFAQDDWSVTPALSVSAGLRWEMLGTRTEGNALDAVRQTTQVLSPLVQAMFKLSASQQLRAGLTCTFKMPTLTNLALRRYTVDNENSPLSPDLQGNPHLLPERAWGLDLAYEHYFGKNAMVSASTYARRIDDVTIDRIEKIGRTWISTPVNAGRADTWGVELEAKFPLQALMPAGPALELRANMARNWSRVTSIPGPDNRLAGQVPFSASVGLDHRMAALPATFGASFSFLGGGPAKLSERTAAWAGVQRELGMYAVWRVDANSQWRMSVANLFGQDHRSLASFSDRSRSLQTTTAEPTSATVRLAFEHKLGN
jgi:outer membrane receptor protein involved in Fe transport